MDGKQESVAFEEVNSHELYGGNHSLLAAFAAGVGVGAAVVVLT